MLKQRLLDAAHVRPIGTDWSKVRVPGRLVDGVLFVTPWQFKLMCDTWGEYSTSFPSGVYERKRWLRKDPDGAWYLCTYVAADFDASRCTVTYTPIQEDENQMAHEAQVVLESAQDR